MPHRAPGSRGCRFWPPWHSDAGDRAAYLCGRCAKPAPPALHRQTCTTCGFPPDLHHLRFSARPALDFTARRPIIPPFARTMRSFMCLSASGSRRFLASPAGAFLSPAFCAALHRELVSNTRKGGVIFLGRSSQNFQSERCQFPLTPALVGRLSGAIDCSGGARVFDLHQTIEKGRSEASPGRPFAWMHRESATASIRLRHPEPSGRLTAPRQAGRSCPSGCFECSYHLMRSPPARDQSERSRRMDTPPATRAARRLDWFTRIAGTANNPSDD